MALIKKSNWKGFEAEYWTIVRRMEDKFQNNTNVELALFKDKVTYEGVKNSPQWGTCLLTTRSVTVQGIDHTREELYNVVKEPKPGSRYIQDAFNFDPPVTEPVETNFFADAEDDI